MAAEKRIGVLTSGGDCAGLNAALRAVVCRAVEGYGWEVIGIREGTQGLLARPVEAEPLSLADFDGSILRRGGTILGTTNKGNPFAYPSPDGTKRDRSAEVIEGYRLLGLDALIGIGGDGSLAILKRLADQGGLKLVAIPKPSTTTSHAPRSRSAIPRRWIPRPRPWITCSPPRPAIPGSWSWR